jgi:uncharacterized membrane protein YeiH
VSPYTFDLIGVFVFAISGALAAGRRRLDLLGVLVLAAVTAVGGGTIRDLLLDRHPIFWLTDNAYLYVIIFAVLGTITYVKYARVPGRTLDVADALGLALFSVNGARIAEAAGMPDASAVLLGAITGAAGGLLRDILTAQIPVILQRGSLYATAAIVGTGTYLLLEELGVPGPIAGYAGMAIVAGVRLSAIWFGLSLPVFDMHGAGDAGSEREPERRAKGD